MPFVNGYGIILNVPSQVQFNKFKAPGIAFQCLKWKNAYAKAVKEILSYFIQNFITN